LNKYGREKTSKGAFMRVIQVTQFGGPEALVPADAHRAIEARTVIGETLLVA